MGWGSGAYGVCDWGVCTGTAPAGIAPAIKSVNVLARDLIEIVFNQAVKNNTALKNVNSYTFTPVAGELPIAVTSVRPGKELSTTSIQLVITPATIGGAYDVAVNSSVVSLSNVAIAADSSRVIMRITKIDSIVSSRPKVYDMRPTGLIRNILNAIGVEDDKIGGSQSEGEEILR